MKTRMKPTGSKLLKMDPSRTVDIRKAFEREVIKRLNRVKSRIMIDLVKQDALGLTTNYDSSQPRSSDGRWGGTGYHGTHPREAAGIKEKGFDVRSGRTSYYGAGTYFFIDQEKGHKQATGYGTEVIAAKLHLANPYVQQDHMGFEEKGHMPLLAGPKSPFRPELERRRNAGDERSYGHILTDVLKEKGYDGVITWEDGKKIAVVFDATGITTNTDWSGLPQNDQVKSFENYLLGVFADEMTGKVAESVWDVFITQALTRGAKRAFDDYMQMKQPASMKPEAWKMGAKNQFLQSAFTHPIAKEKIQLIVSRPLRELKGMTDASTQQMTRALADGLARGDSPRTIGRNIAKIVDGMSNQRATTIARTEVIRAHAEGQLIALTQLGVKKLDVDVEWSTTGDGKVCTLCKPLQGLVVPIEKASGMLPKHPNCVLPGNLIQGSVIAALKANYSGEAIEILTASGCRFSLTINHPIFTIDGLRPAGEIKKGDDLLSHQSEVESTSSPDIENGPTFIEEVFKSFDTILVSKPVTSFDFNGDEKTMMGKVQVVLPNLSFGEDLSKNREGVNQLLLVSPRDSSMGCLSLSESLILGHSAPLEKLSITSTAGCDTVLDESSPNYSSAYTEFTGQSQFGLTGEITLTDDWLINFNSVPYYRRFGHASELDTVFSKPTPNGISFNPNFISELLERFTGKVSFDKVVNVRRFHYSGPVYDVETLPGYFTVSQGGSVSILTKNCRCAWKPHVPLPDGFKRVNGKIVEDKEPQLTANVDANGNPLDVVSAWMLLNAFCPTGKGGGIDPSCGGIKLPAPPTFVSSNKAAVAENNKAIGEMRFHAAKGDAAAVAAHPGTPSPKVQQHKQELLAVIFKATGTKTTTAHNPPPPTPPFSQEVPVAKGGSVGVVKDHVVKATGYTHEQLKSGLSGPANPGNKEAAVIRAKVTGAIYTGGHGIKDAALQVLNGDNPMAKAELIKGMTTGNPTRSLKEFIDTPIYDLHVLTGITQSPGPVQGQAVCNMGSRVVTMGSTSVTGDYRHELGHAIRSALGGESYAGHTVITKAIHDDFAKVQEKVIADPQGMKMKLSRDEYETKYGVVGRRSLDNWEEHFAEHYRLYHREIYKDTKEGGNGKYSAQYRERHPTWANIWDAHYTAALIGQQGGE